MLIRRCIAAPFAMNIVYAAIHKGTGIRSLTVYTGSCTVGATGGYGEILWEVGHYLFKETLTAFKAHIDPFSPGRVGPVAPEFPIFVGRKVHARACFQFGAAMGTAAGKKMHIMHRILCSQAINTGISHKAPGIICISINEFRIVIAEALGSILRKIQHFICLNIDHAPIIQALALIFPAGSCLTGR